MWKYFDRDQIRVATQFIKGLNVDASTALTTMIANAPPYNQSILSADVSPVVWWSAGKRLGFDNALCDVALKLVSAIANSAGLETIQYNEAYIWNFTNTTRHRKSRKNLAQLQISHENKSDSSSSINCRYDRTHM